MFEPDVTFVKLSVKSVDLAWRIPRAAILLSIPSGIRYDSNDFAGKTYKQLKSVVVPSVKLRCLAQTPNDAKILDEWFEIASASFDVNVDIYGAPPNWKADAQRQRMFVQSQDTFTGRASWIYGASSSQTSGLSANECLPCLTPYRVPGSRLPEGSFPATACNCDAKSVPRCRQGRERHGWLKHCQFCHHFLVRTNYPVRQ